MNTELLKELSTITHTETPVVSLYLNVTPPHNHHTEINSLIHTTLREMKENEKFDEEEIEKVKTVLEELERYIVEELQNHENTRMIVIFSNGKELREEFWLPIAIPSQLSVNYHPYTRPLTLLLDKYHRYGILLSNSRDARLFTLYLGEIEDHTDMLFQDYVPDRVQVNLSMSASRGEGIRSGLGGQRVQRHIEDHIHQHLKNAAEKTFELYKTKGFEHLILGGPEDKSIPWLKDHLHSYLQDRVIGEIHIHPQANNEEIKEKVLDMVQTWEQEKEDELIEKIYEQNYPGGKAVIGAKETVEALRLGQVHTFVIKSGHKQPGYICPEHGYLDVEQNKCPMCGTILESRDDIIEEMLDEAIAGNSEIRYLEQKGDELDPHGVAALLRFTLE